MAQLVGDDDSATRPSHAGELRDEEFRAMGMVQHPEAPGKIELAEAEREGLGVTFDAA